MPLPMQPSGATLAIVLLVSLYSLFRNRKGKLPPGPTRLPFFGNALQLPRKLPWITFGEWSKVYGNIVHADLFGQTLIIVNSRKIVNDLFEKRSSIYSDRPNIPIIEIARMNDVFPLSNYGEGWRKQRKMVAQDFASTGVIKYRAIQEKEIRLFVKNLIDDSTDFESQLKLRTGAIILQATYDYTVKSADDPMLAVPLQSLENFNEAAQPGSYLVNLFPILKNIPRWLPGVKFFDDAERLRQGQIGTVESTYNWAKDNLSTGLASQPNLCQSIWEKHSEAFTPQDHHDACLATGSVLGGGLDTGISLALTFFMNMIMHPHIQRKAQAELDSVVGSERLPTLEDRPNLPYIQAIVSETCRFAPSAPLGLPHAVREDDFYEGYLIPKGSWVIPNIWYILHDPEVYPEPMQFLPERYNGDEIAMSRAREPIFGFGRRVCPGRLFAEISLFTIVSTTLATCDILPGVDGHGNEVLPTGIYLTSAITKPEKFDIRLKPRSEAAVALLAETT